MYYFVQHSKNKGQECPKHAISGKQFQTGRNGNLVQSSVRLKLKETTKLHFQTLHETALMQNEYLRAKQ
jgi:hypothetical protein